MNAVWAIAKVAKKKNEPCLSIQFAREVHIPTGLPMCILIGKGNSANIDLTLPNSAIPKEDLACIINFLCVQMQWDYLYYFLRFKSWKSHWILNAILIWS